MTGTPDVSRAAIFDAAKRYLGGTYQQNTSVFDWDTTETDTEFQWFISQIADTFAGGNRIVIDGGAVPFAFTQKGAGTDNNFTIAGGRAFVNGRYIQVDDATFDYEEILSTARNYVVKGIVSGIAEVVASTTYDISDAEKNFAVPADYGFSDTIRILMTSGADSGNIFDIASNQSATSFRCTGDMSAVLADDTYIILPPALSMPANVDFLLVTWFEDISAVEDTDLLDSISVSPSEEPTQRKELRWCIFPDSYSGGFGGDAVSGVVGLALGNITSVGAPVLTAEITSQIDPERQGVAAILQQDTVSTMLENYGQNADFAWVHSEFIPGVTTQNAGDLDVGATRFVDRKYKGETIPYLHNAAASTGISTASGLNNVKASGTGLGTGGAQAGEKLIMASYFTGSAPVRSYEMGSITRKQGFNWYVDAAGDIHVTPGQLIYRDKLYQSGQTLFVDTSAIASWYSNALPGADTWAYVYLVVNTHLDDEVRVVVDVTAPKWDGTHLDPEGATNPSGMSGGFMYCIGIAHFDFSGTAMTLATCVDNVVSFYAGVQAYTNTIDFGATALTLQPPDGASNMELGLECLTADVDGQMLFSFSGATGLLRSIINHSTAASVHYHVHMPAGGNGTLNAASTNILTSGSIIIRYNSISFGSIFPDNKKFDV